MQVTEFSANTFWKGEVEIRGQVADGDAIYRVRILLKNSRIYDCSCRLLQGRRPERETPDRELAGGDVLGPGKTGCEAPSGRTALCSCMQGGENREPCARAEALLAEYGRRQKERNQRPVSTSQGIRFMIREYTNRQVSKIIGAGEEGEVRLVPRLLLEKEKVRVQFSIGKERLYAVKDLVTFAQAVKFERFVEYGKGLAFHHGPSAFLAECRPLVAFLTEMADLYREQYDQVKRGLSGAEPPLRELLLSPAGLERFFTAMEGLEIECRDARGTVRELTVKKENPVFSILVEREGRDGVKISLDRPMTAFPGGGALYLADQSAVYCCDGEYTEALSVFMEYLLAGLEPDHAAFVNDRDMPLFYERVLRRLESLGLVEARGVDLESYRPEELAASFYFDSDGPRSVSMRPTLRYGGFSFHPMEDEQVPGAVIRNVPGECRVSQVITKYFRYTEDGTKNMVIRDDDEAMFRLLSRGVLEFMELGEVLVSEAFQRLRVLPPAAVAVRVKAAEGWLNLELDVGGLSGKELLDALSEYGKKKKFYRMKSGDFLTLGDDGFLTVAKMAHGLDLEKALGKEGELRLPMYRAMYLDGIVKEDKSVSYYRDQLFKAVVRGMKDVEDSDFEIPGPLIPVLREYQKVGFRWLRTLDAYGFGGILADEMGLGKTIQVIALLLDEKRRRADGGPAGEGAACSLIVCPASLVYNWQNELSTFAPELTVLAAAGSQEEREEMLRSLRGGQTDVLITSYDLLKRDLPSYMDAAFRFQIVDEAQYIKNASTQAAKAVKAVRAKTRFALTGTPIENHLGELWSIFDFLMPGFLFTPQKFKKMFEVPIVKEGNDEALGQLHRMTRPFLLRRLKKDVLKELPDKLETVLYSAMEGEQRRLYQANAARLKEQLERGDTAFRREQLQILSELMKLRQICCEPSLCFDRYRGGSAKLDTCMELIENGIGAGHKILLFSQFTSMLDIIASRLRREKIPYHMLTGSTSKKERMQLVNAFHKDQVPLFLISLKAGGTGLNLTAADVVIHYDPWWNVAAQNQATDRAHRIGQEKQVAVFKLITKHTIEENILKLQESKKNLADTVVTEGAVSLEKLTREELISMLGE